MLRILALAGSPQSDFFADLSRLYAGDALAATADPERYEMVIAYVGPDGGWRFPVDLSRAAISAAVPMAAAAAIGRLVELRPDVMVPQMFCLPGMTSYRALFDVLGIPYVGNSADVMALAAHKARAKAVVAAAGVRVPAGRLVSTGPVVSAGPVVDAGDTGVSAHPAVGSGPPIPGEFPVVVKPVDGDNSTGISLVTRAGDLAAAVDAACAAAASGQALVETYVPLGREVRCGVLVRDGELVCLPLEEYNVDAATRPIRGAADKLARDDVGELGLVAKHASRAWIVDRDDPVTDRVWAAARAAHVALGCRHYSLFDFRIDPDGEPWFLEAGLYCSFSTQSVIATMARAAGISLPELFAVALREALP